MSYAVEIRRIDMIIENMQVAEQNPEGMAYIFHPFGVPIILKLLIAIIITPLRG